MITEIKGKVARLDSVGEVVYGLEGAIIVEVPHHIWQMADVGNTVEVDFERKELTIRDNMTVRVIIPYTVNYIGMEDI